MRPLLAVFVAVSVAAPPSAQDFDGLPPKTSPTSVPNVGPGRALPAPPSEPPASGPASPSHGIVHDDQGLPADRKAFESRTLDKAVKLLEDTAAGNSALLGFRSMRDRWGAARRAGVPQLQQDLAQKEALVARLENQPGADPTDIGGLRKEIENLKKYILPVHQSEIPARVKVRFMAMEGDGQANMVQAIFWGNPDGTGLHYMFQISLNESLLLADDPPGETARVLGRELDRLAGFDRQSSPAAP